MRFWAYVSTYFLAWMGIMRPRMMRLKLCVDICANINSRHSNEKWKLEKHWKVTFVIYWRHYGGFRSSSRKKGMGSVNSFLLDTERRHDLLPSLFSTFPTQFFLFCSWICSAGVPHAFTPMPSSLLSPLWTRCLPQLLSAVSLWAVCEYCLECGYRVWQPLPVLSLLLFCILY